MGRVGGLQDGRADPKGVFIFRWEQTTPAIMDVSTTNMQTLPSTPYPQGLPVIYQVNLRDPSVFFAMQNFQMEDGDVMFVANSSLSEIQRFAGIISSTLLPAVAIENSVSN
ncbi:Capsule polysaccharide export protein BexD [Alteripontixanthobacter maritimus]|uniref:Capsule polysaccharide export protein BexD n=1 Tax=Alteripontixanthobacter maritimus TaxID=2161824 RepID=A0A369Q7K6_9SPHN|nr:hypothetical protein [Alteripontixanthobacter maritimus]RDC60694.1 Capsule polysaccharide export protein BexD [Alteripontixanthobacter maritimus]